jgi:flagellar hook protein FlgE
MSISNNVSSLQANQVFMNTNANNIANVNTDGFIPTDTRMVDEKNSVRASTRVADDTGSTKSQTDLAKELPDQITIGGVAEANVTAIKTQDEMFGSLLDIKA